MEIEIKDWFLIGGMSFACGVIVLAATIVAGFSLQAAWITSITVSMVVMSLFVQLLVIQKIIRKELRNNG